MIREYQYEDLNHCVELLIETLNCEPWKENWTAETATRLLSELVEYSNFIGFVALDDDNAIVAAIFARKKTWWTNDEVFIEEFFVKPSMQNKGYGKRLLNYLENYCKENGLAGTTLLTNRYMPAKNFYEKNGYALADHVIFLYKEV